MVGRSSPFIRVTDLAGADPCQRPHITLLLFTIIDSRGEQLNIHVIHRLGGVKHKSEWNATSDLMFAPAAALPQVPTTRFKSS